MRININGFFVRVLLSYIQHYNHKKYWKMRSEVINPNSKVLFIIRVYYLFRIKRMDAYNNASMGTNLGEGAFFSSYPNLPHGLNGIIISHCAKIGHNCTICQQVTMTHGKNDTSAIIGDNCMIGAGAKIIGGVHIGNNVKIGANAVVVKDVPDNCTAIGIPARIIHNKTVKKLVAF